MAIPALQAVVVDTALAAAGGDRLEALEAAGGLVVALQDGVGVFEVGGAMPARRQEEEQEEGEQRRAQWREGQCPVP